MSHFFNLLYRDQPIICEMKKLVNMEVPFEYKDTNTQL